MTIFQLLNGATFAALLFVVASGFTLIFGLMRIVNLAHGALYLFGGYLGLTVANLTGNFFLGAIGAAVGVALIGFIIDFGLLRFVRGVELRQVLLTLGVAFVLNDLALVLWGGDTFSIQVPAFLDGPAEFGSITYPIYRLFVLLVGVVIFISLSLLITKTRLGALIRAGVDDAEGVLAEFADRLNAVARHPGLVVHDGNAPPGEAVEEGGLSDVRTAHEDGFFHCACAATSMACIPRHM